MLSKTISFEYSKTLSISIPYDANLSKNRKEIYTKQYTKRKIKNPAHEKIKNNVRLKFMSILGGLTFAPKTPVLVVISVYALTRSSDAHNFAEGICDAIEKAIKVNDRHFHVYTIPMTDKQNPRIDIEIFQ